MIIKGSCCRPCFWFLLALTVVLVFLINFKGFCFVLCELLFVLCELLFVSCLFFSIMLPGKFEDTKTAINVSCQALGL